VIWSVPIPVDFQRSISVVDIPVDKHVGKFLIGHETIPTTKHPDFTESGDWPPFTVVVGHEHDGV
jgi:hypothetical protein